MAHVGALAIDPCHSNGRVYQLRPAILQPDGTYILGSHALRPYRVPCRPSQEPASLCPCQEARTEQAHAEGGCETGKDSKTYITTLCEDLISLSQLFTFLTSWISRLDEIFPQNNDAPPSAYYAPSKQFQDATRLITQNSPVTKPTAPSTPVRPANAEGATGTPHNALIVHTAVPFLEFFDPEAHNITQTSIIKISPHGSLAARASRDASILHDIWKRDKSLLIPNALNNISLAATALSLLLHVSLAILSGLTMTSHSSFRTGRSGY